MTETLTDTTDLSVTPDDAPVSYDHTEATCWSHGYNTAVDRLAGRIDTLRHELDERTRQVRELMSELGEAKDDVERTLLLRHTERLAYLASERQLQALVDRLRQG